jgi:hypothetical protein
MKKEYFMRKGLRSTQQFTVYCRTIFCLIAHAGHSYSLTELIKEEMLVEVMFNMEAEYNLFY